MRDSFLKSTVRHMHKDIYLIYILMGALTLIMITAFVIAWKLTKLLYSMNLLNNSVSELKSDTEQINEVFMLQKNEKEIERENSNKKQIKKLDIDLSSNNYMIQMYGFIEQTKMFSVSQISGETERLPYLDIQDYIKRQYLLMFSNLMQQNNLSFDDFKINYTYGGIGPNKHYYIKFKLKDTEYFGWDEWVSKGTLSIEMKDGNIKQFEVDSYVNNLEDYFETNNEDESIHFFDALIKLYSSFTFDNESYKGTGGYDDDSYVIVINELINLYNNVGKKWNVIFADAMSVGRDGDWNGKLEDVFVNTKVIDNFWVINGFQEVKILEWKTILEKQQEIFDILVESIEPNEQFKLATMYYYGQFKESWDKEEGYYQKKAIQIFKKLAEDNHAYSQLIMGILYFDGAYLLKNFSKSKSYIELAFENGLESPARKVWEDLELYKY